MMWSLTSKDRTGKTFTLAHPAMTHEVELHVGGSKPTWSVLVHCCSYTYAVRPGLFMLCQTCSRTIIDLRHLKGQAALATLFEPTLGPLRSDVWASWLSSTFEEIHGQAPAGPLSLYEVLGVQAGLNALLNRREDI